MPGMYQKLISVEHSDLEVVIEGAVAVAVQMNGTEGTLVDSQWIQECKATLSKIKTKKDLTRIGNAIYKAEATFFGQQNDRIRTYLQRRHFSGEEIEWSLASGLWMRIIRYTYLNFTQLLQSLMHLSLTQGYTSLLSR